MSDVHFKAPTESSPSPRVCPKKAEFINKIMGDWPENEPEAPKVEAPRGSSTAGRSFYKKGVKTQ